MAKPSPQSPQPATVLFACVHNAGRSQMAAALFNRIAGPRRARAASANADAIRILVRDAGPGIEARHLPRLFERFYRVEAGRSREQGGTGLGLAIVKHLCEAMGGSVGVESHVGLGTTFHVILPRA